jgi:hypothetical protein
MGEELMDTKFRNAFRDTTLTIATNPTVMLSASFMRVRL